jgi:hypothetical protein
MGKYYVYGLVDPRINQIKYIGKGSGRRMFRHFKYAKNNSISDNNYTKFNALKEIYSLGYEDIAYRKFFESDDEEECYNKETELISEYNTLIPNGWNLILINCHKRSGQLVSEETRKKLSIAGKGNKSHTGQPSPLEVNQKISQTLKEKYKTIPHPNKGKKTTLETKEKLSISHKGQTPWNTGKNLTEEHKKKVGESVRSYFKNHKRKSLTDEQRKRMSDAKKLYYKKKKERTI